jgi:DNA-binding MarR family transcriptional regulator
VGRTLTGVSKPPGDEVDRLVEAWRRERPELDVSPMEVLSRVTRLARHLDIARREAFAGQALETWEFDVLTALRRSGAPYQLSPGRLLKETLVTSGTMTNRVDRMALRGLVERLPDLDDRRGVLVRLTDAGRTSVDAALDQLLTRERLLLDGLALLTACSWRPCCGCSRPPSTRLEPLSRPPPTAPWCPAPRRSRPQPSATSAACSH